MMRTYSLRTITDLVPGDHLCCLYKTEEEHQSVLTPFLRHGLEQGEKVLYIADAHTAQAVLNYLRRDGMDVERHLAGGQLGILSTDDTYLREGVFDPDEMIVLLRTEMERALAEGFSALRVTGEMSWVLRGLPGSERLIEYEAKLNTFFRGSQALAICQYDRRCFEPELLLDVLVTHPIAVVGQEIYDNSYYMAPKEFLGPYRPAATLANWLENLAERKRAEDALRETKEFYENLVGSAGDAIVAVNRDGNITVWNTGAEGIFGYTQGEALGHRIEALLGGMDKSDEIKELRQRAFDRRGLGPYEARRYRKGGTVVWVAVTVYLLQDSSGKAIGVSAIYKDITERKRTEENLAQVLSQLERSNADLLAILNGLSLGTAITDQDGRVVFLSKAAQDLVRKKEEEASGKKWEQLFPLQEEAKAQLKHMAELPPDKRKRLPVRAEVGRGRHYWMDIDVQDDPRDPQRKIFFLYDMTEVRDLRGMLDEMARFYNIVGRSALMRSVYQQVQDVSQVDWTVLIEGETGTGKELVARAIHSSSRRKERPFIAVNCAGLTDSLLASQLFGHKRGAFTSAVEDHEGLFEAANGGALFLDEIGDVSANVQTSLLRALEGKEITRLGESKPRKIDVRIIAATQRNLSEEVEKGNFRLDLFYRLRVARIKLPPLLERREDIPLLVAEFLGQCRAATGKPVQEVSDKAMRKLLEYGWPGNVRELRSAVEFAVIHCRGSVIQDEDLPPEIVGSETHGMTLDGTYQDEQERVLAALEKAGGNRTAAARLLGMSRATFYRRLGSLSIEPTE